jgi:hypothetical protein
LLATRATDGAVVLRGTIERRIAARPVIHEDRSMRATIAAGVYGIDSACFRRITTDRAALDLVTRAADVLVRAANRLSGWIHAAVDSVVATDFRTQIACALMLVARTRARRTRRTGTSTTDFSAPARRTIGRGQTRASRATGQARRARLVRIGRACAS